jgi:hypothetical protein
MSLGNGISRAMKPDAQGFDAVYIDTIPRYKQSGLSGDEWRISATIKVLRKGIVVAERSVRNVQAAAAFLPGWLLELNDDGKALYAGEANICDQEGCAEPATVTLKLKARYCREGHRAEIEYGTQIRKFCAQHKRRGDCGLEDADSNYEEVPGP